MDIQTIIFYAVIFIAILAVIFIGGRYVQRLPSYIVKKAHQISFAIAIGSGILLYMLHHQIFIYIFLAALAGFFLFFNYKEGG